MPTIQQITPAENRIFLTSLGDWASDGYWSESGLPYLYGLMMFDFKKDDPPKTATLAYPSAKAKPGYTNSFSLAIYKPPQQSVGSFSFELTDGNYSFTKSTTPDPNQGQWGFSGEFDIPNDWIKENTTINIAFTPDPEEEFTIACTNFSLQYEATQRTDHLPLTGVH